MFHEMKLIISDNAKKCAEDQGSCHCLQWRSGNSNSSIKYVFGFAGLEPNRFNYHGYEYADSFWVRNLCHNS